MEETKSQMAGRRRLGRRLRLAAAVTAGIVAAALVVKFAVAPRILRRQLVQAISDVWDGQVRIEGAELDFSGKVRASGLELIDRNGLRWARVAAVSLAVRGLARLDPVVHGIELSGVELDFHFRDGRCRPPIKTPPPGAAERLDLRKLAVRDLTVRIMPAGSGSSRPDRLRPEYRILSAATYEGLTLKAEKHEGVYSFELSRSKNAAGQELSAAGTFDPQSRIGEVAIELSHRLNVNETSAIFRALGWRQVAAAQGKLTLAAKLRGSIKASLPTGQAGKPQGTGRGSNRVLPRLETSLEPLGRPVEWDHSVRLSVADLRLDAPNGLIADEIHLAAEAANGSGTIRLSGLTAPPGKADAETALTYDLARGRFALARIQGKVVLGRGEKTSRFWNALLHGVEMDGTIHVSGSLDYAHNGADRLTGSLHLRPEELRASVPGKGPSPLVLSDIGWDSAVVTPRRIQVSGFSARTCDGTVAGDFNVADWPAAEKRMLHLNLKTSRTDLARLEPTFRQPSQKPLKGRMDLELALRGRRFAWEGLAGRGKLSIDKGDFWSVPVLSHMFDQLSLLPTNPATISDVRGVFDLHGPVVRIRHAAVTNKLAGLECTGGTVNLRTRFVDVKVVGGTFLSINPLSKLLLRDIKSALLARRVRGRWDELTGESFVAIPAGQIADSSVNFLVTLARGGGNFGVEVLKGFEKLFKAVQPGGG